MAMSREQKQAVLNKLRKQGIDDALLAEAREAMELDAPPAKPRKPSGVAGLKFRKLIPPGANG